MNKAIETISSETMDALCQYHWPGNIRELQNVIERAVILSPGPALVVPLSEMRPILTPMSAGEDESARSTRRRPARSILAEVDPDQIIQALKGDGWPRGRAKWRCFSPSVSNGPPSLPG